MKRNEILLTAFLEGGLVMLLEVSSPLIVAPVLGSSVNIWAILICISIAALAIGYFLGGSKAAKGAGAEYAVSVFALNSLVVLAGWFLIYLQNNSNIGSDNQYFSWLIIIVLLFIPLLLFGSTTPVLIASLNFQKEQRSDIVGKIYSISTFGGILFSFLAGFYFIPSLGLSHSILLAIIFIAIQPFIFYFRKKRKQFYIPLLIIIVLSIGLINTKPVLSDSSSVKLLEYSEGINGQLIVADINKGDHNERMLFINRMGQTWFNTTSNYSVWGYPNYITSLGSIYPQGASSLVLGLGGGVVARQLKEYCKHNVDAVELDSRIVEISKKYFNLKQSGVKIFQDDARRFIKKSKKKYDFIVLDIFNGEIAPSHGLSKESFEDIKERLAEGGMIVINFNGFLTGKEGRAGRSLYKTLLAAGFKVNLFATNETEESERNVLYIAYLKEPLWKASINVKTEDGNEYFIDKHFLSIFEIEKSDAVIITDDKPVMEQLNRFAAEKWREGYYKNFTLKFKEEYNIPLTN
jgi:predicted membrane-bound spermidine synthase